MSALWAIQTATNARLIAETDCPWYDGAPDNAAVPYGLFGATTTVDRSTKTIERWDITYTLHVFSGKPSNSELFTLMEQVRNTLQNELLDLEMDGYQVTLQRIEFEQSFSEDQHTRHGVQRLRASVRKIN